MAEAGEKKYDDSDWLRGKYHEEKLSYPEIADQCDVAPVTIRRALNRHDIPIRSMSVASKLRYADGDSRSEISDEELECPYTDEDWLAKKYYDEGLNQQEIAEVCGVSDVTISNWMDKFEMKTHSEMLLYKDEGWLREQYIEKRRSAHEIGDKCGVSGSAIYWWLDKYGIETRELRDAFQDRYSPEGEDHWNWKGGDSHRGGEGWFSARKEALERASHACENPECDENRDSIGHEPDVHHIIPSRVFEDPSDSHHLDNLVVLCRACHKKAEPSPRALQPIS